MKEWIRYPPFELHARLKYIVNDMEWMKFCESEKDLLERGTPAIPNAVICSERLEIYVELDQESVGLFRSLFGSWMDVRLLSQAAVR